MKYKIQTTVAKGALYLSSLAVVIILVVSCSVNKVSTNGKYSLPPHSNLSLLTENGLLYPPELWSVIEPTTLARLSYAQINHEVSEAWDLNSQQTTDALLEENPALNEIDANYIVSRALLNGLRMNNSKDSFGINISDLNESWNNTPNAESPIISMLKISTIARQRNFPLTLNENHKLILETAFHSNDLLQAAYAYEISEVFMPGHFNHSDLPHNIIYLSDTPAILASLQRAGLNYESLPHQLANIAIDNAFFSDEALVDVVVALQNWNKNIKANELISKYDKRRVISAKKILDQPNFSGTEGSTYRVLRYEAETGNELTTDSERKTVLATLENSNSQELSTRLAVTASLAYLAPNKITGEERSNLIKTALKHLQFDPSGKLHLEDAFTWMSIAEIAESLNIKIIYQGLSEEAFQDLENESPEVAAHAVAKLILGIKSTKYADTQNDLIRLSKILEKRATKLILMNASTSELVYLQTAYEAATNRPLFSKSDFNNEIDARQGNCRGGFLNMVRETRTPDSECALETNRLLKGKRS